MKRISLQLILISILTCSVSLAEQITAETQVTSQVPEIEKNTAPDTSSKPRIDIGAGYWYTWASLDTKLVAVSDLPGYYLKGDKISELNYDTDAGLFVINADAYLLWRLYADAFVAMGNMHDANQIDSDWLMQISQSKWLESKASAEGDVTTWNANLYFRVLEEKENKGYFDVSLGYIYYRDDITKMNDLVYRIVDWEPANTPVDGLNSSDKYTFDGLRIGARARIKLNERFSVKLFGGISPWLRAKRDGFWNLRDMEIKGETDGGTSFDIGAGVEFTITKNLFIEVGYRYLNFDTDKGDYSHTVSGVKYQYNDGWDNTEASRGGFYAMGRLKI